MRCAATVHRRVLAWRASDDPEPRCQREAKVGGFCRQHFNTNGPKVYCGGNYVTSVMIGRLPVCPNCGKSLPWLIR